MKRTLFRGLAVSGVAILAATAFSPAVSAQAANTNQTYHVNLAQSNKSGVSGTGTVTINGNNVTVALRATGLSPNRAHITHIHVGGQATCPAPTADANKDGYVDTKEGESAIGPMRVSLTTSGDTSTNSSLAFDRMPKADANGNMTYNRTFTLPSGVTTADLAKATIEVHGIATLFGDKAIYDGEKRSEMNGSHAFETTVPAACGKLTTTPTGGAATGVGSINGIESPALLITGAVALFGAVAAGVIARKQMADQQ